LAAVTARAYLDMVRRAVQRSIVSPLRNTFRRIAP
jgi:hypothetical protein